MIGIRLGKMREATHLKEKKAATLLKYPEQFISNVQGHQQMWISRNRFWSSQCSRSLSDTRGCRTQAHWWQKTCASMKTFWNCTPEGDRRHDVMLTTWCKDRNVASWTTYRTLRFRGRLLWPGPRPDQLPSCRLALERDCQVYEPRSASHERSRCRSPLAWSAGPTVPGQCLGRRHLPRCRMVCPHGRESLQWHRWVERWKWPLCPPG